MLSNELTVHGKVLLLKNVDRGRGGWVSYEILLLAHIRDRRAKLGGWLLKFGTQRNGIERFCLLKYGTHGTEPSRDSLSI